MTILFEVPGVISDDCWHIRVRSLSFLTVVGFFLAEDALIFWRRDPDANDALSVTEIRSVEFLVEFLLVAGLEFFYELPLKLLFPCPMTLVALFLLEPAPPPTLEIFILVLEEESWIGVACLPNCCYINWDTVFLKLLSPKFKFAALARPLP